MAQLYKLFFRVKQNRGWRKRWVIFDGKNLRYYSNQKVCNVDLLKNVFSIELQ